MSFFDDVKNAEIFENLTPKDLCFECGEAIEAACVRYDGFAEPRWVKSIFMHPACAALVGQRLITDGYPNRHKR